MPKWIWAASFSLLAFAANSLFCRLALAEGDTDPVSFTIVRLVSGGLFLLCLIRRGAALRPAGSWRGALALFVYAYLFSVAYVQLDAGAGALILFGAVQITMFACSWAQGERFELRVVLGMLIAFAGLTGLLVPGATAPPATSAVLMIAAGCAWGTYSLIGKGSANPLADTAGNFSRSILFLAIPGAVAVYAGSLHMTPTGLAYALGSGVLASGAGYAVWYSVVKQISGQHAAIIQLGVPVVAALGGVMLLHEPLSFRLVISAAVVVSGIGVALITPRKKGRSKPTLDR